jgi:AcrR family transcriptional regulator
MSRGRAPKFQLQRANILERAADLFARNGFHNASMLELAKECDVSKALLYHYYKDKEEILFDIADSYVDRLIEIIRETKAHQMDPEAYFAKLVCNYLLEYEHSASKHMVLVQDVKFLQSEMRLQVIGKQRLIVDEFSSAIASMFPAMNSEHLVKPLTMSLFGMINWTFTWLKPSGSLTFKEIAPLITNLFIRGAEGISSEISLNKKLDKKVVND